MGTENERTKGGWGPGRKKTIAAIVLIALLSIAGMCTVPPWQIKDQRAGWISHGYRPLWNPEPMRKAWGPRGGATFEHPVRINLYQLGVQVFLTVALAGAACIGTWVFSPGRLNTSETKEQEEGSSDQADLPAKALSDLANGNGQEGVREASQAQGEIEAMEQQDPPGTVEGSGAGQKNRPAKREPLRNKPSLKDYGRAIPELLYTLLLLSFYALGILIIVGLLFVGLRGVLTSSQSSAEHLQFLSRLNSSIPADWLKVLLYWVSWSILAWSLAILPAQILCYRLRMYGYAMRIFALTLWFSWTALILGSAVLDQLEVARTMSG